MKIQIFTIGKKNETWIDPGVRRFLERLRQPFASEMIIIPQSPRQGREAAEEESEKIINKLNNNAFIILLDERGKNISSPDLTELITSQRKQIVIVIGGAYGVSDTLRKRADFVWSLSRLVFPHQLVRLILAEQLYRAQEISRGGQYHHE